MPMADTVQKAADWLGVDAKWLLSGDAQKANFAERETFINDLAPVSEKKLTLEERMTELEEDHARLRTELAAMLRVIAFGVEHPREMQPGLHVAGEAVTYKTKKGPKK